MSDPHPSLDLVPSAPRHAQIAPARHARRSQTHFRRFSFSLGVLGGGERQGGSFRGYIGESGGERKKGDSEPAQPSIP